MDERLRARLAELEARYEALNELMADPDVLADLPLLQRYAREHGELRETVAQFREVKELDIAIADALSYLEDEAAGEDMRELARETVSELEAKREGILVELRQFLAPADPNNARDVILEIRGSAGGDEANLFARELFRMYSLYAENKRWKLEVMDLSESGIGGIKEVIAKVAGSGAYGRLKFESGVHRVQRVPATESSGRIHTSTASVNVLPEAEEVDIEIRSEDLRVDVYRSAGHGGQGVNTTDSAVRITHLPTGLVVTCQNQRSQLQNKASAMEVLRARLYEREERRRQEELGEQRRSQVQTGDRSEKIRTYNFPQDRVTDHRIGVSLHNLPAVLAGGIDPFIDELQRRESAGDV